jgi:hypothetical protein
MRRLPKSAALILDKLISTGKTKIDNSEGIFMPVHIEKIMSLEDGDIYSLAHYYIQNGDVMSDPEVEILKNWAGDYFPFTYRLDSLGIMQNSIKFDQEGRVKGFYPRLQREHAQFTRDWLLNIKDQQNL